MKIRKLFEKLSEVKELSIKRGREYVKHKKLNIDEQGKEYPFFISKVDYDLLGVYLLVTEETSLDKRNKRNKFQIFLSTDELELTKKKWEKFLKTNEDNEY